jgi:hypothetical protein
LPVKLLLTVNDVTEELLAALRRRGLRHASPTYRALGYSFAIQCDDTNLSQYLSSLFTVFRSSGRPQAVYSFGAYDDQGAPNYVLYCDDQMLDNHRRPAVPFATLLWHINRRVVMESQDWLLVHASAVASRDVALLFPAAMESGKTTLAAGLVRAGLKYITDEVTAIDVASGDIEPFPRALSVDPGSWEVLADLRPVLTPEIARYTGNQWQLPPSSMRDDCIAGRSRAGFIITPKYTKSAKTELVPLSRADGLRLLAQHSFNFVRHGHTGLRVLADVARRSACYRLVMGDLDVACDLILDLVRAYPRFPEHRPMDAKRPTEIKGSTRAC